MKRQTNTESVLSSFGREFHHRLREVACIVGFALASYLLLSLITYHQTDPGWSHTGSVQDVANAGGRVGAWFADAFLNLLGYVAYLLPIGIAFAGWQLYRPKNEEKIDYFIWFTKLAGFLLMLLAADGLIQLHALPQAIAGGFKAGGIIGYLIAASLVKVFNYLGTSILLICVFLSGMTLSSGLSWFILLETLGRFSTKNIHALSQKIKMQFQNMMQRLKETRQPTPPVVSSAEPLPEITPPQISIRRQQRSTAVEKSQELPPIITEPVPQKITPPRFLKKTQPRRKLNEELEQLPSLDLLEPGTLQSKPEFSREKLEARSCEVEERLKDFGVEAKVVAVHPGPVVTRFELQLAPGLKVSKITNLAKDLARSLSTVSVRIVEVIPGKAVVGLEIPNENRSAVRLREILSSDQYQQSRSSLSLALGKDIAGHPVVVDLAKMPHLLVAGTTGSGKSVGLNTMLLSILFKSTPEQVRLILIDPKMLELSIYEGIPHLLTPVVTDMKEAASALRWCVVEMDKRYRLMANLGVRNLPSYNQKVREAIANGKPIPDPFSKKHEGTAEFDAEPETLKPLPYVVVVVDEFADMMMVVGKKVEELIARIAQKARAAGIHMILATQRPSVDVITGLIKSNIPTRISFQVSSRIDSRTVLDQQGAEQLLGQGDMLYLPPGSGVPTRVHGAFVSDEELHNVAEYWKQFEAPEYIDEIRDFVDVKSNLDPLASDGELEESDPLYDQAVAIVTESRRASISLVQRRLKIGYNRAASILEAMERAGVVSIMESNGSREVLAPPPVQIEE